MSRVQKFHCIELAPNADFRNAVFENLEKDPTELVPGRIWYNSNDKCFKGVFVEETKDSDGNTTETPKIFKFNTAEEFYGFIEKLASVKPGEGSHLVGFMGHDGANDKFSIPSGNLEDTLKSLVDGIDADRKVIDDNLAKAEDDISKVQDELDNTQSGAGLDKDGNYVPYDNGAYIKDAKSINEATQLLDKSLVQEVSDRKDADAALQKQIDDFEADANGRFLDKVTTDDQTVASNVTFQKNLYVNGDLTIKGEVTQVNTKQMLISDNIFTLNSDVPNDADPTENAGMEVNRGKEGIMPLLIWDENDDTVKIPTGEKDSNGNYILVKVATGGDADALQKEVDRVEAGAGLDSDGNYVVNSNANYISGASSLADADNKLDAAIKSVSDKCDTNNTTIRTEINSIRYTYESSDEATSFDIKHNLGSEFIDVMLWVYDDDEKKYYNDSATISVIDANTIHIDLTSASKIRVTVENMDKQF